MAKITVINGPNLNLLGIREPGHYGHQTLEQIENTLKHQAKQLALELKFYQSNAEHIIVETIHHAFHQQVDFIIINPAAFTHTSVAIRDALLATQIPFIEIHLSNIYARETFRSHSYLSDIASGIISGLGANGYEFALQAAYQILVERTHHGH